MKLPVNYVDVRMEQLLQRIQTNYEMAKDEESKRMIIELLLYALDVMEILIKAKTLGSPRRLDLSLRTEGLLDGFSKTTTLKSYEGYAE